MFHQVEFIGYLGRDPEMRYTPTGKPVTTFSVASSRHNGEKTETIWFRVTAWDKLGELVNLHLKKGSKVFVQGRLNPGDNGSPVVFKRGDDTFGASYDVVTTLVRFLDPKSATEQDEDEESIPF